MSRTASAGKIGTSARVWLKGHRFGSGQRAGPAMLSPAITRAQRQLLDHWLHALPADFAATLPRVKIAVTRPLWTPQGGPADAGCFIRERYLLLDPALFSRRGELGRVLYHELCHFLWPRLGRRREQYAKSVARQHRAGVRGELGYPSELALLAYGQAPAAVRHRAWRNYLCENFCDTGAYALLRAAGHRRSRHSQWTLAAPARRERVSAWYEAVGAVPSLKSQVPSLKSQVKSKANLERDSRSRRSVKSQSVSSV